MARRPSGDGSIYERKDGRFAGSFRTQEGKQKYVYGKTQREALDRLRRAQQEDRQGLLLAGPDQTVANFIEYWIEIRKLDLGEGTYRRYQRAMKLHILPDLGTIKLRKLSPEQVQRWINRLSKKLAPGTVRYNHALLSSVCKHAMIMRKITLNPCAVVVLPKKVKRQGTILTPAQAMILVEVAQDTPIECLLTLALTTAMRRGEMRALKWTDIHFEKRELRIAQSLSYLPDDAGKYRYVELTPKSEAGHRTISLPDFAIEVLKAHRARQNERRLSLGERWQDRGLVFPNTIGNYLDEKSLWSQFKRTLQVAGLPDIRLHDLRHSSATILIAMGVHPKVIQELLGHSTISTTMDVYGHVFPTTHREAMQKLDVLYKDVKKNVSEQ